MGRQSLTECNKCGDIRPTEDFYVYRNSGKEYTDRTCKRCRREKVRIRAQKVIQRRGVGRTKTPERLTSGGMSGSERRAHWATYKARKGCADCGSTDWRILEFDHLPNHQKLFTISEAIRQTGFYSDEDIAAEVAKCDVVCRPCHLRRTSARARAPRARDSMAPTPTSQAAPTGRLFDCQEER